MKVTVKHVLVNLALLAWENMRVWAFFKVTPPPPQKKPQLWLIHGCKGKYESMAQSVQIKILEQ